MKLMKEKRRMLHDYVRTVWTILRKDLAVWIRQPITLVATFAPPLCFLLVSSFGAIAVGRSPVALVTLDQGRSGIQMQQILHDANAFTITDASPEHAQLLFKNIQVAAIITIPADFTARVTQHQQAPIDVRINNLNLDFSTDIRQQTASSIAQFYQAQGSHSAIKIVSIETDLHHQDVTFFQYSVIPIITMMLIIAGVVNGGFSAAREWESRTVKSLLLAPVTQSALITGKVLAGFLTTLLMGTIVLLFSGLLGWIHPEGSSWLNALVAVALIALMGSGIGVALGATLQRLQRVIGLGTNVAFYLFFLAGGTSVLAFLPTWLQTITAFIPLTYGRHALETAVFYSSSDLFGRDVVVLSICALAALGLGTLAMRKEIAA